MNSCVEIQWFSRLFKIHLIPNLSFTPCAGGASTYSAHICFLHRLPWFQCQWAAARGRGPPAACSDPTHGPPPPGASDASRSRPESSAPRRSAHRWTGAAPQRYSALTRRDLREVTGCVRIRPHAACYLHSVLTGVRHFVHWCGIILPLHCKKKQAEFCIIVIHFLKNSYCSCCSCWSAKSELAVNWYCAGSRQRWDHRWLLICHGVATVKRGKHWLSASE